MYIVSDVVDMGEAHELVLGRIKEILVQDDTAQQTMPIEENFDN